MKKILSIMICVFALLALTACGGGGSGNGDASYGKVDVDLAAMSSTMAYSAVVDMSENPQEYKGKTVRIKGDFASMYGEQQGKMLYACLIRDETACCTQGLEFEPTEKPADSLEQGSEITVAGVLDSYEEGDATYCTLKDAVIL